MNNTTHNDAIRRLGETIEIEGEVRVGNSDVPALVARVTPADLARWRAAAETRGRRAHPPTSPRSDMTDEKETAMAAEQPESAPIRRPGAANSPEGYPGSPEGLRGAERPTAADHERWAS